MFMNILKWLWTGWYTIPHLVLCYLLYGVESSKWQQGRRLMYVKKIGVGYSTTVGQAVGMSMAIDRRFADYARLHRHEFEHTKQALRWGPLWPFVYFGAIGCARLSPGVSSWREAYLRSRYERLARAAE